jgi:Tfp pilus assembly pilus retraction ATPase PilT
VNRTLNRQQIGSGVLRMIDTKQMLAKAIETGASDVHINIGMPPIMRINTELLMMDLPEVSKKTGLGLFNNDR